MVVFGSASQIGQFGSLARRAPRPSGVTDIGWGTVSVRLNFDRRLPVPAPSMARIARCRVAGPSAQPGLPSSSEPRSHRATAAFGGGAGTSAVCRRSTGWAKPRRVVLGDRQVGDPELHSGGPVVGADRGDPHPWGFAVGQRRGDRLARLVEPQRGAAGGGFDLDAAHLGADGGRAGRDGDDGCWSPDGRNPPEATDRRRTAVHWTPTRSPGRRRSRPPVTRPAATSGIAVASDDELDAVSRPPVHAPKTVSAPGTG